MRLFAAHRYSRRGRIRQVAYSLKVGAVPEGAALAIARAAKGQLPASALLVPVPDRTGATGSNGALVAQLSALLGLESADPLTRAAVVASTCDRHKAGMGGLPVAEHRIELKAKPQAGRPLVLVDNVATSGNTLTACRLALEAGGGEVVAALVWADAGEYAARNARKGLHGRGFVN